MWQKTVNDMYEHTKTANTPLLSSYNAEFWADYVQNFTKYDKLFRRLYKSFWYFDQLYDDSVSIVTTDFTDEVYNHLLANNKKYSELYRINVVNDNDFSIVDNYNITENMSRETEKSVTDVFGQRNDSESDSIGSRTDNKSESLGQRTDSKSETIGSRQDSANYTQGAQSNQTTVGIEGFNSSSFQDADKTTEDVGQRSDSNTSTVGAQNNSESSTLGAQSNSSSSTIGPQTNTKSFTKGSQSDSHSDEGSESYTLTRNGNIGIKTAQEVMKEQKDFWTPYEFYTYIFRDIARELLMV